MKTSKTWAFIHNLIAHPLLALTGGTQWAEDFHDYTAGKAWPRS